MKRYISLGIVMLFLTGCTLAKVQVNVVSERTSLENQVLGSYNALTDDVLLVASVRGVDPLGRVGSAPPRSREYKGTMEAVQTIAFHSDDIDELKRLGWVGENNVGFLSAFPMDRSNVPVDLKEFAARYQKAEFEKVLEEVNSSRKVLIRRIVETNENFGKEDIPKVKKIFGKLNREKALPGEKVQIEDGSWIIKK